LATEKSLRPAVVAQIPRANGRKFDIKRDAKFGALATAAWAF
jgi:hypothetical protein